MRSAYPPLRGRWDGDLQTGLEIGYRFPWRRVSRYLSNLAMRKSGMMEVGDFCSGAEGRDAIRPDDRGVLRSATLRPPINGGRSDRGRKLGVLSSKF